MTDSVLQPDIARHFRNELRQARAATLQDAEAFEEIIFSIERLGQYLTVGRHSGFGSLRTELTRLASGGALSQAIAQSESRLQTPFDVAFELVRQARNAALHEGAFARHLTAKTAELALMLEDALTTDMDRIGDFMVHGVTEASPWQPLSFVRQAMLANSFSFLPVWLSVDGVEGWWLVSDHALASYLRAGDASERKQRLRTTLQDAAQLGGLELLRPLVCAPQRPIVEVLLACRGLPILVHGARERDIVGIATPYDLL